MSYYHGLIVLVLGLLLAAPGCTTRNPNYLGGGGGDGPVVFDGLPTYPDGSVDDRRRGDGPQIVLDQRPIPPDSLPWACQKDSDCADPLGCTIDLCNAKKQCEHTLKPYTCLIGGTCYNDYALNPQNGCQACLSNQSTSLWSPRADGAMCTSDGLYCTKDACVAGKCEHKLDPGACLINNHCYFDGDPNPSNACESCNPASPLKWSATSLTCYQDLDGDGFGNSAVTKTACSCTSGWAEDGGDCNDNNKDVFPGQTKYFTGPILPSPIPENWDYNCNMLPEPQYLAIGYCYKSGGYCKWQPGWVINTGLEPPLCGVTKAWINGCQGGTGGTCVATTVNQTQGCH